MASTSEDSLPEMMLAWPHVLSYSDAYKTCSRNNYSSLTNALALAPFMQAKLFWSLAIAPLISALRMYSGSVRLKSKGRSIAIWQSFAVDPEDSINYSQPLSISLIAI